MKDGLYMLREHNAGCYADVVVYMPTDREGGREKERNENGTRTPWYKIYMLISIYLQ